MLKTDQVDHSNDEDSSFELIVAEELFYSGKTHLVEGPLNGSADLIWSERKNQPLQKSTVSRKFKVQREILHQNKKDLLGFDHNAFVFMPIHEFSTGGWFDNRICSLVCSSLIPNTSQYFQMLPNTSQIPLLPNAFHTDDASAAQLCNVDKDTMCPCQLNLWKCLMCW